MIRLSSFELPDEMPRFRTKADVEAYLPKIKGMGQQQYITDVMRIFRDTYIEGDSARERMGIASPGEISVHIVIKEQYNMEGMFAFVSKRWIDPFAKWIGPRKVLEVMSGAGHIAAALRDRGVDLIATDDYSWIEKREWTPLTEIERIDAVEAVNQYGAAVDVLLMSWPYMDNTAYQVLKRLYEVNPAAVCVYIGEWYGCTADDQLIDNFGEIEDDEGFNQVARLYQHWAGLHDRPYLGRYRPKREKRDALKIGG